MTSVSKSRNVTDKRVSKNQDGKWRKTRGQECQGDKTVKETREDKIVKETRNDKGVKETREDK